MRDTTPPTPSIDDVADHLFAAFRPQHRQHGSHGPHGPHGLHGSNWPARDVTLGQLKTLFMLRSEGPLSIGRIAEAFGIGAAAASGYVERIERHGLVERRHRTDDRRIVDCHLTETGAALLEELAGMRMDSLRRALGSLSPEELTEFDRLLVLIAERAGQPASTQ